MSYSLHKRESGVGAAEASGETWLLLLSTYALIASGALLLSVTEMSLTYALLAWALCGVHLLLIGRGGRPLLSRRAIQLSGVVALLFALARAYFAEVHISYSLGHFLILVQLIILFGEHRIRDIRLVQVTAIFEVLIANIWALEPTYLPAFLLTAGCLMASMVAVELHGPGGQDRPVPRQGARPGLGQFLSALWLPALFVFVLTTVGFMALPRARWLHGNRPMLGGPMTGFSESVSLWEIGALRESDRRVFRARFSERTPQGTTSYSPQPLLMRGIPLPTYRNGQWLRGVLQAPGKVIGRIHYPEPGAPPTIGAEASYKLQEVEADTERVVQEVTFERPAGETLFALYRPLPLDGAGAYSLRIASRTHRLVATRGFWRVGKYTVVSLVPKFRAGQLRRAGAPPPTSPWLMYWQVPHRLLPVLQDAVRKIEAGHPTETDYDRVAAAVDWLTDTTRFTYTKDAPGFSSADPVEAFLTETHRGYCEHFASALALIVRVWGIPSRLVVGYKNGSFEGETRSYVFRDLDAHAWVEVYFNEYGWVQFDPTPTGAAEGPGTTELTLFEKTVGTVDSLSAGVLRDIKRLWNSGVVGYSRSTQRRLFERVSKAVQDFIRDTGAVVRNLVPGMPELTFLPIALLVVGLTAVAMGLHMLAQWLEGVLPGFGRQRRRTLRFYEKLLRLLRRKGLRRASSTTPRELARAAATQLAGTTEDGASVPEAIHLVTDLYCRVRFGRHELTDQEKARLREALRTVGKAEPAGAD
ncbi:MAG: transglutaminaseTgpA domain-containing protein [Candidatus Brocadiia bacterium]